MFCHNDYGGFVQYSKKLIHEHWQVLTTQVKEFEPSNDTTKLILTTTTYMAALSVLRTMMKRLGFSNTASEHIYTDEGIDSLKEVAFLSGEGISNLMKTVQRGGHKIEDLANLGNMIWALGFCVSNLAEENFKMLDYYVLHGVRVFRTVNMPANSREIVCSILNLRETEKDHVDPDTKPSVLPGYWSKTQYAIHKWLSQYRGAKKSPLATSLHWGYIRVILISKSLG